MPSSRLLLPSPLSPTATTSPSGTSSRVSRWLRKSRSSIHRKRTRRAYGLSARLVLSDGSRQTDRHHEVGELAGVASDHAGLQPVLDLETNALPRRRLQAVREVSGVERHRDVLALVPRLHGLDRTA